MFFIIKILFAFVFNCFIFRVTRLLSWMRYCEFKGIFITSWCSLSVMLPISVSFLFISPSMISDNVWDDLRMGLHSIVLKGFFNAHKLELTNLCSITFFTTGRLTASANASTCIEHLFRFNVIFVIGLRVHIALSVSPVMTLLTPLWVTSSPWLINPSVNPESSISGNVVSRWCRKFLNKRSLLLILLATLWMWVSFRSVSRVLLWVSQVVLPLGPSMLSLAVGHDN